ncbi:MAG TPA: hypothetical protein VM282_27520 [Acidimicrobiales bacterium]|nr:hypothetical protein [Acidimicrobiales bacterium]
MDPSDDVVLRLTVDEVDLLVNALDSHEYWQLGDCLPRKDGYVFLPGDMERDTIWEGRVPDADQRVAIAEIERCRLLADVLQTALRSVVEAADVER